MPRRRAMSAAKSATTRSAATKPAAKKPRKGELTVEGLAALGAERLAALLLEAAERDAAFKRGLAMARDYARMSGYADVRLLEISEVVQGYGPMMRGEAGIVVTAAAADASTPIEPGEVGTGVSITVKYEMVR